MWKWTKSNEIKVFILDAFSLSDEYLNYNYLNFLPDLKIYKVKPEQLMKKEDYDLIRINTDYKNKKPYVFLYILGNPMACNISDIFKFAHKKGLDVVYVASQGQLDKYDKKYPQIGEWIDYLAKSEFVVTNSFHCTVFALLYKKKIMSIPLVKEYKRMNVRITELLQESNLISSIYRGDIDKIYNQIVDFSSFQEYKEREIGNTESYLSAILKKWN